MSWLSNGSNGAPTNQPFHDLDLVVVQLSDNAVVASSDRFDSTIEVVDFTPIPNEQYAVRVSARRCHSGMVPFTVAWATRWNTSGPPESFGAQVIDPRHNTPAL